MEAVEVEVEEIEMMQRNVRNGRRKCGRDGCGRMLEVDEVEGTLLVRQWMEK